MNLLIINRGRVRASQLQEAKQSSRQIFNEINALKSKTMRPGGEKCWMSEVELCEQEAGNVGGQRSYVICFQGCK
jgi:hypothetical protein